MEEGSEKNQSRIERRKKWDWKNKNCVIGLRISADTQKYLVK